METGLINDYFGNFSTQGKKKKIFHGHPAGTSNDSDICDRYQIFLT